MRAALGSDERTPLTDAAAADLRERGFEGVPVGAPGGEEISWAEVGRRVGELVAAGEVELAVLFCWTGTGVSIAANRVRGVRAALCADAVTAAGARRWNDANVLVMSLRSTSVALAGEMLEAWLTTQTDPAEAASIASLDDGPVG